MIVKSEDESSVFNLSIWKSTFIELDSEKLYQAIVDNEVDILKITIDANNKALFDFLDQLNIPYATHYQGYTIGMKIDERVDQLSVFDQESFDYKQYDSTIHHDILYDCVQQSMREVGDMYYDNNLFNQLIPKEKYLHQQAMYACTYDNKKDPSKIGFIGFNESGEYFGFYLLDIKHPHATAYMGGVLPKYRGYKVGYDGYVRIIKNYLRKNGFCSLKLDVHMQNILNIHVASLGGKGLLPQTSFIRVNVYPLLNYSNNNCSMKFDLISLSDLLSHLVLNSRHKRLKEIKCNGFSDISNMNVLITGVKVSLIETITQSIFIVRASLDTFNIVLYVKYF
jgi:hypothetical protein